MQTVLLTGDGRILRGGDEPRGSVLPLLRLPVELAEGYTLASFFALVSKHSQLTELSEFLPGLLERAGPAPDAAEGGGAGPGDAAVDALTLSRTVEMVGFPGKPRMEIYTSLAGTRDGDAVELRHLQVEDLLGAPLGLGPLRHVVLGDDVDIFEFATVYTLFEFIEGVSWALSFHAAPKHCNIGR